MIGLASAVEKLREAEYLLLPLEAVESAKMDLLHEAKIHIWKAIEKIAKANNE